MCQRRVKVQQGMSICPVIGEDTAVCVYYSEDICLLLAILVFQSPTLGKRP